MLTESQSQAEAAGDVGANVATQTGSLGLSTASMFAGSLGAIDRCLTTLKIEGHDTEDLVRALRELGFTVTPPE